MQMWQGLKCQIALFLLDWLIRYFLHELHADIRPMEGYGVALEHDQIRIFDIKVYGSGILDADDAFSWHILY